MMSEIQYSYLQALGKADHTTVSPRSSVATLCSHLNNNKEEKCAQVSIHFTIELVATTIKPNVLTSNWEPGKKIYTLLRHKDNVAQ